VRVHQYKAAYYTVIIPQHDLLRLTPQLKVDTQQLWPSGAGCWVIIHIIIAKVYRTEHRGMTGFH